MKQAIFHPGSAHSASKDRGEYHIDMMTGAVDVTDTAANVFRVGGDGHCELLAAEQPASDPVLEKDVFGNSRIVLRLAPFRHAKSPRLFVIQPDGAGYELIQDSQLAQYFTRAVKSGQVDIIEQPQVDSAVCISVLHKEFGHRSTLVHRKVIRICRRVPFSEALLNLCRS
jgi:hypothetical protein